MVFKREASPPALSQGEGAFSHRWGEKAWLKFRLIISNVRTCLVFALLCSDDSVRGFPSHPSLTSAPSGVDLKVGRGRGRLYFCCKVTTFIFVPCAFWFSLVFFCFPFLQVLDSVREKSFLPIARGRSIDTHPRVYRCVAVGTPSAHEQCIVGTGSGMCRGGVRPPGLVYRRGWPCACPL